jgi:hypothetical protein
MTYSSEMQTCSTGPNDGGSAAEINAASVERDCSPVLQLRKMLNGVLIELRDKRVFCPQRAGKRSMAFSLKFQSRLR